MGKGLAAMQAKGVPDPARINAELLAKGADTVPLLLSFLESGERGDFYVRYHTIQLLTALAGGGPYRLQGVRVCVMLLWMDPSTSTSVHAAFTSSKPSHGCLSAMPMHCGME